MLVAREISQNVGVNQSAFVDRQRGGDWELLNTRQADIVYQYQPMSLVLILTAPSMTLLTNSLSAFAFP